MPTHLGHALGLPMSWPGSPVLEHRTYAVSANVLSLCFALSSITLMRAGLLIEMPLVSSNKTLAETMPPGFSFFTSPSEAATRFGNVLFVVQRGEGCQRTAVHMSQRSTSCLRARTTGLRLLENKNKKLENIACAPTKRATEATDTEYLSVKQLS